MTPWRGIFTVERMPFRTLLKSSPCIVMRLIRQYNMLSRHQLHTQGVRPGLLPVM